jgi:hypothetical protein
MTTNLHKQRISPPARLGEEIGGEGFVISERDLPQKGTPSIIGKLFEVLRKANELGLEGKQLTTIELSEELNLSYRWHVLEINWKKPKTESTGGY